ncbi:hypothetical protein [Streptomyces sp. NPDC002324]
MDAARDDINASASLEAEATAELVARIALEIPTFDRSWRPEEITGWLDCLLSSDQPLSDEDVRRAKQAVSEALGVDA